MGIELSQSVLIVLAGGKSTRFGEPKGLKQVNGLPLISWQAARFRAAGGGTVVFVLGHHVEPYAGFLTNEQDVVVINPEPERGSFRSLQWGIAAAKPGPEGALFLLPVDVPAPDPQVWRALERCDSRIDAVVPTHEGQGGHPVRLSSAFAAQLREIPWNRAEARLDAQINALPEAYRIRVPVQDVSIRLNLNTPAAFLAWESSLDKSSPAHNS